jgi:hypothetical protein
VCIQGGCRTPPANIFKCVASKTQAFFSNSRREIDCRATLSTIKKREISAHARRQNRLNSVCEQRRSPVRATRFNRRAAWFEHSRAARWRGIRMVVMHSGEGT